MQTTLRLAAALSLIVLPAGACHRSGGGAGGGSGDNGIFAGGDVVQDTTVRFGPLDTSLLTNGSGWVRTQQGVTPPNMQPQQLQAPPQPNDSSQPDTTVSPLPDSLRRARVRPSDSLRRPMPDSARPLRDTTRPDTSHPIPDSTDVQELLR